MILTVVGTLAGAVIGIIGTLLAQRQANRAAAVREERALTVARRAELRATVFDFLLATQRAEQAASDFQGDRLRLSDAAHNMWISHKQLALICSPELEKAASHYCDELGGSIWAPTEQATWERTRMASQAFRGVARAEVGTLVNMPGSRHI